VPEASEDFPEPRHPNEHGTGIILPEAITHFSSAYHCAAKCALVPRYNCIIDTGLEGLEGPTVGVLVMIEM
jgi:hypothetical protein